MPLQDLIGSQLVTCSPDTSVRDVAQLMKSKNVGAVLVTEDGLPSGIVTDRDLVLRCVIPEKDFDRTPVRDVMTHSVETVTLAHGVHDVVRLMKGEEIRRVVVVDDSGKAVGLLSFSDLCSLLARELNDLAATEAA